MEHILIVHSVYSFRNLVQAISAEFFRVVLVILDADVGHGPMFHELQDNEDLVSPMVQIDALDHLLAIKMCDQTCLVDDCLHFCFGSGVLDMFHRKKFTIGFTLHFEDFAEAALSNRFKPLVFF